VLTTNEQRSATAAKSVLFGSFRLEPTQQLLLEGDRPVAIGARALAILVALVERAGEVIGKEDLIARVWPDVFVEESNLRVHVAALRRALRDGQSGNRFVVNVPGRGYSFVAPILLQDAAPPTELPPIGCTDKPGGLPLPLTRVIGRSAVVEALSAQLGPRRFVTLVGPGGIGKTTVAVAVARAVLADYRDGVAFVDFGAVSSPQLVPSALASVLGLAVPSEDAIQAVSLFLRHKHMLLVLDSCEHVIEAAAAAAEEVTSSAASVHILATSREPLRAAGERVHRLPPLENPSESTGLTGAEALTFPGIQLFVERAAATLGDFALSDADAPIAADICRRLDGIALAIELAAGRVAAFGLRGLAARLDDRFRLLTSGRRTALPRHQTLAATLDWSYELLPEAERSLLRRLSLFTGDFSLEAAAAVFGTPDQPLVAAEIGDLVDKSLVVADSTADPVRYRLLDTTRLYCLDKLRQGGELATARRAHAVYFRDLFARAEADCETLPTASWLATYASQLDNVRAALDWAASTGCDLELFVSLTIGAVPLWVQLSLMGECRGRVEQALDKLSADIPGHERSRMQLCAARGWALMYGAGRSRDTGAAWATTLQLAEKLGDTSYRLRALWGMWIAHVNKGDFAAALDLALQLLDLVRESTDALDVMMADRLLGVVHHYRGDQAQARQYLERMLGRYRTIGNQPRVARFQIDQKVTAHYFLARILWLQGYADRAKQLTEINVAEGIALGHALSFGSVLGQGACPVALFTGDLDAAQHYGAMLRDHAEKHGLGLWHEWAVCFGGLVTIRQGDLAGGLAVMRAAFERAGDTRFLPRYMLPLGEYAAALGLAGEATVGLATIDGILARCDSSEERWYVPEALRIRGELYRLTGTGDPEAIFLRAIALARQQHAPAWELRCTISLAHLMGGQGRHAEGCAQLAAMYDTFSEGYETADLRAAASWTVRAST
jgi:predicted ATPase/DNA-binding winged helix-turn-helix (wHTH) protein